MRELTPHCILNALSQTSVDNITVQVTAIKSGKTANEAKSRTIIFVSDGETSVRAIVSGKIDEMIESGAIRTNSIIHINSAKVVKSCALLFTDCEVIDNCDHVIGSPKYLAKLDNTESAQPTYQQPAQPTYQQPSYQQPVHSTYQQPTHPTYQQPAQISKPNPTVSPLKNNTQSSMNNTEHFVVDCSHLTEFSVSGINPFMDAKWFIQCRVTNKSTLRTYSSARGEGKLFNVDLLDKEGGEIRATFFNEQADAFFDYLEIGKVYYFSGFRANTANRTYNHLNCEYELNATRNTRIMLSGDNQAIQNQHYNFVPISEVERMEPKKTVDILAIVESHQPMTSFRTKKGTDMNRKELKIVDSSNMSINFTLFGNNALITDDRLMGNPVIAIKNAIVSDFGGHSLSGFDSTSVDLNPTLPEAEQLRGWFSSRDASQAPVSLSTAVVSSGANPLRRKLLSSITDESLGYGEKADYITVKAMIHGIPHERDVYYPSCPSPAGADGRKCQKKVIQDGDGMWHCDQCNQSFEKPLYRFIFNMEIVDFSDSKYVTVFNPEGEMILGISADQLVEMKNSQPEKVDQLFKDALFQEYIITLRVKQDDGGNTGEQRVRCSVQRMTPVDKNKEVDNLISIIENMSL